MVLASPILLIVPETSDTVPPTLLISLVCLNVEFTVLPGITKFCTEYTHDADDAGLHVVSVYPLLSKENMFVANVPPGLAE